MFSMNFIFDMPISCKFCAYKLNLTILPFKQLNVLNGKLKATTEIFMKLICV